MLEDWMIGGNTGKQMRRQVRLFPSWHQFHEYELMIVHRLHGTSPSGTTARSFLLSQAVTGVIQSVQTICYMVIRYMAWLSPCSQVRMSKTVPADAHGIHAKTIDAARSGAVDHGRVTYEYTWMAANH